MVISRIKTGGRGRFSFKTEIAGGFDCLVGGVSFDIDF